ncbi:hypothetical protein ES708_08720 [subsurface metagenome]
MSNERRDFMNDLRAELAQEWAKKHNIQLSLFSRQDLKEREATKRERKLTEKVKDKEKFKDICQGIKGL